ncbi:MAG: hypothetical protein HRT88_20065, partial [Lentisphaeraceae bacterium]|nr:hypothetical protein [Lentisphaeraceae bacterium]
MVIVYFNIKKVRFFEQNTINSSLEETTKEVESKINNFEKKLNAFFQKTETSINQIASEINQAEPKYNELVPLLKKSLQDNKCTAIGAHFADDYDKVILKKHFSEYTCKSLQKTLYAPFFTKRHRDVTSFPYDYTDRGPESKNKGWYDESIKSGSWFGPYFGSANNKMLISYRAPFNWDKNKAKNQGLICADYSLEHLRHMIADIHPLNSGYGIMLTSDGTILSHPVKDYLGKKINEINSLQISIEDINSLEQNKFQPMTLNTREQFIYTRDLGSRNWKILLILNKKETLIHKNSQEFNFQVVLHKMKVWLILVISISVFLFTCLLFFKRKGKSWYISTSFTVLCILAILFIWNLHLLKSGKSNSSNIPVANKTDLEAALNSFKRSPKIKDLGKKDPVEIKTGLYIQSVKFTSANDIYVTGYAWQKAPLQWQEKYKDHKDSSSYLSLVLPEAESSNIELVYSDKKLTRWYFEASLRQAFNYLQYPFDEEEIWIRMSPRDFYNDKVILVPDFDSFPDFEINKKNGLEGDIFLEGWDISKTFYSFRKNNYSSNFGRENTSGDLKGKAELYFNLSIRRQFVGVSIAYMIPLNVVAFLLFAVLITRSKDPEENSVLGFNAVTILAYCSSLFFVLIV